MSSESRFADDRRDAKLERLVEQVIRETLSEIRLVDAQTHERHHDYIEALLQRERDRAALRKAIIEKTLTALVWAALVWTGSQVLTYLSTHWKP